MWYCMWYAFDWLYYALKSNGFSSVINGTDVHILVYYSREIYIFSEKSIHF